MEDKCKTGRVTIPTDLDVVPETLEILKKWGADAIRDCDGTDFPQQLQDAGAKVYATYYTTRKDNALGQGAPGRGAAVLHHDGLLHRPGETAGHPAHEGHQPGADAGQHARRHHAAGGRSSTAPRVSPCRRRQWRYDAESGCVIRDSAGAVSTSIHGELPRVPHLGSGAYVQRRHERLDEFRAPDHLRCAPAENPRLLPWSACGASSGSIDYVDVHPLHHVLPPVHARSSTSSSGKNTSTGTAIPLPSAPYILEQFEQEVRLQVPARSTSSIRATTTTSTGCPARNTGIFRPSSAARSQSSPRRWWTSPTRCGERGHDVPRRSLDRHRAVHAGVRRPSAWTAVVGTVGNGSTLRLIADIPGVQLHRGPFPAVLLPGHLPSRAATRCARPRRTGSRPAAPSSASPSTASATAAI